jgi:hypothetical protein
MYYLVYKTTNLLNNRYYIGAHKSNYQEDKYLGSGLALKSAVAKYGEENFKRETLLECNTSKEMFEQEKTILGDKWKTDPLCYNMKPAGKGGFDIVNESGMNRGDGNAMRNPELKAKQTAAMMETRNANLEHYNKVSTKNIQKAIAANTGKKRPKQSERLKTESWFIDMYKDPIQKEEWRLSIASEFKVVSPTEEEFITTRLEKFCKDRGLCYGSVWNTSRSGKKVSKGKSKDWICYKI